MARETHLPAEIFYGLLRAGLPSSRRALLSRNPQSLRKALESTLRSNILPSRFDEALDHDMEQLQQATVQLAFESPDPGAVTSLGNVLATAIPWRGVQEEFMTAYVQHQGPVEEFWKALANRSAFHDGIVEKLQFTLQMGALTRQHIPLVQQLHRLREDG